jgi:hypothetical protein
MAVNLNEIHTKTFLTQDGKDGNASLQYQQLSNSVVHAETVE